MTYLHQTVRLTRQQEHVLGEFGPSHFPQSQCSATLATCGVREWPTCDNLIALGLIERTGWDHMNDEGWHYELTPAGIDHLRSIGR